MNVTENVSKLHTHQAKTTETNLEWAINFAAGSTAERGQKGVHIATPHSSAVESWCHQHTWWWQALSCALAHFTFRCGSIVSMLGGYETGYKIHVRSGPNASPTTTTQPNGQTDLFGAITCSPFFHLSQKGIMQQKSQHTNRLGMSNGRDLRVPRGRHFVTGSRGSSDLAFREGGLGYSASQACWVLVPWASPLLNHHPPLPSSSPKAAVPSN